MGFSKLFSYKSVDMPNKSGHDEFHRRYFSGDVGTLTPSFVDFLIPGDTVDLSGKFEIQLPPMATDFYGRINLRTELFYVPCRILFGGWKDFITYPAEGIEGPAPDDPNYHAKYLPGASSSSELFARTLELTSAKSDDGSYTDSIADYGMVYTEGDSSSFTINQSIANANKYSDAIIFPFQPTPTATGYDSGRYYYGFNISHPLLPTLFADDADSDLKGKFNTAMQSFCTLYLNNYFAYIRKQADNGNFILWNGNPSGFNVEVGPGSLLDYLGFKVSAGNGGITTEYLKILTYSVIDGFESIFNMANFQGYTAYDLFKDLYELQTASSNETVLFYGISIGLGSGIEDTGDESLLPIHFGAHVSSDRTGIKINNILPLVCYHKIFDDWYRDPRIMKPLFPSALRSYGADTFLENIAYIPKFSGGFNKKYYSGDQLKFYDGKSLFDLRQRLWQKDYFTTMTAQPQAGDSMKVSFDVENASGEFTIAALRVANSMQQWLERNNLVSPRYGDVQYAQYGVYPSDAITDRSIYLGSQTIEVYNKAVYQQGSFDGNGANPFDSIGAKYGAPVAMDSGSFCNNYMVKEHGFLMALTSLVPEASYGSGTRRFWHYDTIADIAFPLLQGVGDQEVYAREIIDTYNGEGDKTVIGYQERYIEYKFIEDSVHGRLRDGENLSSFMLQRTFSEPPELGADFLEIPKDYLNQVGAVNADVSEYGYWGAVAWDYRKVSSLSSANATPTLGRMVDVHTITVPKGGTRL